MDIATLLGLVGATITISVMIMIGGNPSGFIDTGSLILVIFGTFFVVCTKFNIKFLPNTIKVAFKAFLVKLDRPEDLVDTIADMAKSAKKNGLLSLESFEVDNGFMKRGIGMLVDGYDPEVIESIMLKEKSLTLDRHAQGQQIFNAVADVAPAMGMIGTLIGLVQMLGNLEDPKSIGPAMAVAILTTLYGAIISNMFAIPVADKLALRSQEEEKNFDLIIDGIMGIAQGLNATIIRESLREYLPAHLKNDPKSIEDGAEPQSA